MSAVNRESVTEDILIAKKMRIEGGDIPAADTQDICDSLTAVVVSDDTQEIPNHLTAVVSGDDTSQETTKNDLTTDAWSVVSNYFPNKRHKHPLWKLASLTYRSQQCILWLFKKQSHLCSVVHKHLSNVLRLTVKMSSDYIDAELFHHAMYCVNDDCQIFHNNHDCQTIKHRLTQPDSVKLLMSQLVKEHLVENITPCNYRHACLDDETYKWRVIAWFVVGQRVSVCGASVKKIIYTSCAESAKYIRAEYLPNYEQMYTFVKAYQQLFLLLTWYIRITNEIKNVHFVTKLMNDQDVSAMFYVPISTSGQLIIESWLQQCPSRRPFHHIGDPIEEYIVTHRHELQFAKENHTVTNVEFATELILSTEEGIANNNARVALITAALARPPFELSTLDDYEHDYIDTQHRFDYNPLVKKLHKDDGHKYNRIRYSNGQFIICERQQDRLIYLVDKKTMVVYNNLMEEVGVYDARLLRIFFYKHFKVGSFFTMNPQLKRFQNKIDDTNFVKKEFLCVKLRHFLYKWFPKLCKEQQHITRINRYLAILSQGGNPV